MKLSQNQESIKKTDNIVVIGTSAGGILALKEILLSISKPLSCPVVVVMHRLKNVQSKIHEVLQHSTSMRVKEAEDKEALQPGIIYIAPSNYHLLVERDKTISLNVSEKVNFSRPSIDVTFFSIGEVYGMNVIGAILTGANTDGASGLRFLKKQGATVIVQNLKEAQVSVMPEAAYTMVPSAKVMTLHEIADFISEKCID